MIPIAEVMPATAWTNLHPRADTDALSTEGSAVRVLELSNGEGAAAYAAKLFARWGSEVIKVESPDRVASIESEDLFLNGGKKRVTANYRTAEGRAFLDRLAASCDILITDAPAAQVIEFKLLELGGDSLRVRSSITPFGLSGPYALFPATEATLLALASYTSCMGDPGRPPLTLPGHFTAYIGGSFAYVAALAAAMNVAREPDLATRNIEISLIECLMGLGSQATTQWLDNHHVYARHGNRLGNFSGTILRCEDGWFAFSLNPQFWEGLAMMLGRPELIESGVLSTHAGRLAHRDEVEELLSKSLVGRRKHELFKEAQEVWRVPTGYGATLEDGLTDIHLAERDFWRPLEHPEGTVGRNLRTPGSPFRFQDEAPPREFAPAMPGAHTAEFVASPTSASANSAGVAQREIVAPARPLEGVRVLDLTHVWAGPLAARILADLGADVISIEPFTGRGPAVVPPGTDIYTNGGQVPEPWNRQPLFNMRHRNRRSLSMNLKMPRGHELFLELVKRSDVVIENFSARAMRRLDLGYDQLRAANPQIIYLGMPSFGSEGPYSDYVGFGPSLESMTGIMALMGYSEDEPRASNLGLPDPVGAVAGAAAIVTALERRQRTGESGPIEFSQHEAGIAFLGEYFIQRQLTGREPERLVNADPTFSPSGVYRCAGDDEWIAIAARTGAEWAALCAASHQTWATDPLFATPAARLEHRSVLDAAIDDWTRKSDKSGLMMELLRAGVPAGAVLTTAEQRNDAHLNERGFYADLSHPRTGDQAYDGSPMVFNGTRGYERWTPAPTLGEDNANVLRDVLGLGNRDIAQLFDDRVIATSPPQ